MPPPSSFSPGATEEADAKTTASVCAVQPVIRRPPPPPSPLRSCLVVPSSSPSVASDGSIDDNHDGEDVIMDDQAQPRPQAQPQPQRQRRYLSFNSRTRIYLIPTLGELTAAEFAAVYRTKDDEADGQAEIIRTIHAMAQHNFHDGDVLPQPQQQQQQPLLLDGDPAQAPNGDIATNSNEGEELTTRGLEHMRSNVHVQERRGIKLMVTDAILTEQEEQWDCGRDGAEFEDDVADVSRSVTARSVQEALERAAVDAAYVRREVAHELYQEATHMHLRSLANLGLAADLPINNTVTTIPSDYSSGAMPSNGTTDSVAPTTLRPTTIRRLPGALSSSWPGIGTNNANTNANAILNQMAPNAAVVMSNATKGTTTTTSASTVTTILPSTAAYLRVSRSTSI